MSVTKLSVVNHDRDAAGMTYVYPVVSRRAGGVSVGVNLNPNDACNWRCVYCQVPNLSFGKGPPIDLAKLEEELRHMLEDIVHGDFMERSVPEGSRRLNDVALSGNGEPTTSPQFAEAVELIGRVLADLDLLGKIRVVLITNGSMSGKPRVQAALRRLAELSGEIWFKVDSVTSEGTRRINSNAVPPAEHLAKLRAAAELCPTWVQTCVFAWQGEPPSDAEMAAYVDAIAGLCEGGVPLQGVLLYTLARPSLQPEAPDLSAVSEAWMDALAARLRARGVQVRVSA
ncbi:MAG: radical SAM protein [Myxococcales bacterium]|nr:radical SAM protein [Myxococcales bacterium]